MKKYSIRKHHFFIVVSIFFFYLTIMSAIAKNPNGVIIGLMFSIWCSMAAYVEYLKRKVNEQK